MEPVPAAAAGAARGWAVPQSTVLGAEREAAALKWWKRPGKRRFSFL